MIRNTDLHTDLSRQIHEGSRQAFEAAFHIYYPQLYKFACILLNDPSAADDIVQDVFLHLWMKHRNIIPNTPLSGYLVIAVRNACFNTLKRNKNNSKIDVYQIAIHDPGCTSDETEKYSPEVIRDSINALPNKCRRIFQLVAIEQYKYQDAAEMLGISVNTVKTQIRIAYKILREQLAPLAAQQEAGRTGK